MAGRNRFASEDGDVVGCGVVKSGEEVGVLGDFDSVFCDGFTDFWVVENGGGDPGVGITGVASASSAVETGTVRIVGGFAAVSTDEHEAGEVVLETHVGEGSGAEGDPLFEGNAGGVAVFAIEGEAVIVIAGGLLTGWGKGVFEELG